MVCVCCSLIISWVAHNTRFSLKRLLLLGTVLNNLGRIYFTRGDYDQAMTVYQEVLEI
jgi:tetratricopeptide (TPR) repeat protein